MGDNRKIPLSGLKPDVQSELIKIRNSSSSLHVGFMFT
jgi:hypothetical protein